MAEFWHLISLQISAAIFSELPPRPLHERYRSPSSSLKRWQGPSAERQMPVSGVASMNSNFTSAILSRATQKDHRSFTVGWLSSTSLEIMTTLNVSALAFFTTSSCVGGNTSFLCCLLYTVASSRYSFGSTPITRALQRLMGGSSVRFDSIHCANKAERMFWFSWTRVK